MTFELKTAVASSMFRQNHTTEVKLSNAVSEDDQLRSRSEFNPVLQLTSQSNCFKNYTMEANETAFTLHGLVIRFFRK